MKRCANRNGIHMQQDVWLEFFAAAVQRAGLTLSEKQHALFFRFMIELLEWNRSTNLTRIVEPQAIAIKHFLDSILITRHIQIANKNIADVGSGGGFPGIPLAILEPDCSLVLIESLRKKTSFLKHMIRALQLSNVEVYNGRAQDYPAPASFDLVISRAVASLSDFTAIAARLIRPQGCIMCMKGQLPQEEIETLNKQGSPGFIIDSHSYCLPEFGEARSVVMLRLCFT
jgi:16S rRNA (guanine527-N7)-methyltransferase